MFSHANHQKACTAHATAIDMHEKAIAVLREHGPMSDMYDNPLSEAARLTRLAHFGSDRAETEGHEEMVHSDRAIESTMNAVHGDRGYFDKEAYIAFHYAAILHHQRAIALHRKYA